MNMKKNKNELEKIRKICEDQIPATSIKRYAGWQKVDFKCQKCGGYLAMNVGPVIMTQPPISEAICLDCGEICELEIEI